jgi:hypothetical protein
MTGKIFAGMAREAKRKKGEGGKGILPPMQKKISFPT